MVVERLRDQQAQQQGERHCQQNDVSEPPCFVAGLHRVQYIEPSPQSRFVGVEPAILIRLCGMADAGWGV